MNSLQTTFRRIATCSITLGISVGAQSGRYVTRSRKIEMNLSSRVFECIVRLRVMAVVWIVFVSCGCHLQEQPQSVRVPAVATRFTNDPLAAAPGCPPNMPAMAGLPNLKVGLAMQSFRDPATASFEKSAATGPESVCGILSTHCHFSSHQEGTSLLDRTAFGRMELTNSPATPDFQRIVHLRPAGNSSKREHHC